MKTKYYVDLSGKYLGGFSGCVPSIECAEVETAPDDARQIWDFSAKKWLAVVATKEEKCCSARSTRDNYLLLCDALTNRHRDQVEASLTTTLTNEQFLEVLSLKQSLRDIPQQAGFPDSITWPSVPAFLQSKFEDL